jgi:hypothetical protein
MYLVKSKQGVEWKGTNAREAARMAQQSGPEWGDPF